MTKFSKLNIEHSMVVTCLEFGVTGSQIWPEALDIFAHSFPFFIICPYYCVPICMYC